MKLSALAHVLVASLVADDKCTPNDIRCNEHATGVDICDGMGEWSTLRRCPLPTVCKEVDGKPSCEWPVLAEVEVKATPTCHPATYRCEANGRGWDVCTTSGDWVLAGRCPSGTRCLLNPENGSPYCLPSRTLKASDGCEPATYRCEPNKKGWDVCVGSGDWEFAGLCPPDTVCKFFDAMGSPYCVPGQALTASNTIEDSHKCKPATYRCDPRRSGWDVCNTSGDWVFAGRCPFGTVCKFNKENNSPYCLPRGGFNAEIVMGDKGSEDDVEVGDVEIDVEIEL